MTVTISANFDVELDNVRRLLPGVGWWPVAQDQGVKNDGMDQVFIQMNGGDVYVASGQIDDRWLKDAIAVGSRASISGEVGQVVHLDMEENTEIDTKNRMICGMLLRQLGAATVFLAGLSLLAVTEGMAVPFLMGTGLAGGIANPIASRYALGRHQQPKPNYSALDKFTWHQ